MKITSNLRPSVGYVGLGILLGAVMSCQPAGPAVDAELEALAQRVVEMYQTKNWDMIDELLSPTFVRHDALQPTPVESSEALKEYYGTFLETAYPGWTVTIHDIIAKDDLVATRYTFTGTNTGPRGDLQATGNQVEIMGVNISRVVAGQIVEEWNYQDQLSALTQLGFTITPPQ
jgi:predicted ester cyclase